MGMASPAPLDARQSCGTPVSEPGTQAHPSTPPYRMRLQKARDLSPSLTMPDVVGSV